MKQLYFLSQVLFISLTVNAQPILQHNCFYEPGDWVLAYDVATENMHDGPDGANQIWDFTDLHTLGNSEIWGGSIIHPGDISDFPFFGMANVAMALPNGSVRYWSNQEAGLVSLGQGGDNEVIQMHNGATWFEYPFEFGSISSDESSGTLFSMCRDWALDQLVECEGVGYGTLILPNGTYENVLKIRRTTLTTRYNANLDMERHYTVLEHIWMSPEQRGPLLYQRSWSSDACPGSNEGAEMFYTIPQQVTHVETQTGNISLGVFPNPARQLVSVNIRSSEVTNGKLWISDMLGQHIYALPENLSIHSNFSTQLDLGNLRAGLYLIHFQTNKETLSQRIMVL
ncbi:MAG: T9SS C-terminal target domain-containing protein [Cryomorphaceae bacterium]|nr:MAG: T9SS C-terminal target domain-containing protein [Cryomorphaceae bacterium]